jgi:hypothetical protein
METTIYYMCITLRKRLDTIETEFAIEETLSTAIAEWLETGEVNNVSNYPIKYANAILSQEQIGWRHFFSGKISQEWLSSTAQTIATYIISHRKAIANSVKKYMAALQAGVTSVVQWIRGWSNNDGIIEKLHARQRQYLLETDGLKKERRRRRQPSNVQQKSIVGFISLMAVH